MEVFTCKNCGEDIVFPVKRSYEAVHASSGRACKSGGVATPSLQQLSTASIVRGDLEVYIEGEPIPAFQFLGLTLDKVVIRVPFTKFFGEMAHILSGSFLEIMGGTGGLVLEPLITVERVRVYRGESITIDGKHYMDLVIVEAG